MAPDPQPPSGAGNHEPDIAMWGAPGSGKTAFLASLSIALNLAKGRDKGWQIVGDNPVSVSELIRLRTTLLNGRTFPQPTEDLEYYNWLIIGPPARGRRRWWTPWKVRPGKAPKVKLTFLDAPGGQFAEQGYAITKDALVKSLIKSRGLIYIFDPDRESREGDAFRHLDTALQEIAGLMLTGDEFVDGKLPHYIAVCTTKYDEPQVLRSAVENGFTESDPDDEYALPRVPEDRARDFFKMMLSEALDHNAEIILNLIETAFHQDRIRYFVTSSIGVFVDQDRGFDLDDPANTIDGAEGERTIRGAVRPVNIMEPVIWLGRMLQPNARGDGK
ncbi:hypothetical protein [Streptosporangium sp. NPDC048865]|uniref:hypothetical protein n=1 Tax=Streptosporangium sp. NPDC048865 TaxID=3155766 RepID=UPI003415F4C6